MPNLGVGDSGGGARAILNLDTIASAEFQTSADTNFRCVSSQSRISTNQLVGADLLHLVERDSMGGQFAVSDRPGRQRQRSAVHCARDIDRRRPEQIERGRIERRRIGDGRSWSDCDEERHGVLDVVLTVESERNSDHFAVGDDERSAVGGQYRLNRRRMTLEPSLVSVLLMKTSGPPIGSAL